MVEIKDNRNREEYTKAVYYRCHDTPIRLVYTDDLSHPIGADTIDPNTGILIKNATLISKVDRDPLVEEITEEEFYALCEQKMQKTMIKPISGLG